MSPSHAGSEASGFILFSGVSQVSTKDTEGSGDCESGSHYKAQCAQIPGKFNTR